MLINVMQWLQMFWTVPATPSIGFLDITNVNRRLINWKKTKMNTLNGFINNKLLQNKYIKMAQSNFEENDNFTIT